MPAKSQLTLTGLCLPMYLSAMPLACISMCNMVWHDIYRYTCAAERGLDIGICGKQCTRYRPYYPTAMS